MGELSDPCTLGIAEAAAAIRSGRLHAGDLVAACLERIAEQDDVVRAWAFLDADHARSEAERADRAQRAGAALGPLHGVPIGVKDVFDTRGMPTEYGTPIHAGRRPTSDAAVVTRLRAAGAIILGKTVTTELAGYTPGPTRNPHDPGRTPGGSSSGSAAAVAAGMVPGALGTQTNGSVIRPASYCGVHGFKPTFGRIPRTGMLRLSQPLDQVGVFARSVADVALLADVLMGYEAGDPATAPGPPADLVGIAGASPPLPPRLGFIRTPVWTAADQVTRDAFAALIAEFNGRTETLDLDQPLDRVHEWHRMIMEADLAKNLAREYRDGGDLMSPQLREMVARGRAVSAVDYNRAVEWIGLLRRLLETPFRTVDALLTPATTGPAPMGLDSTGSPVFCTIWTYLGLPAITLPLFTDKAGLPFGAQLVGPFGDDARLLRTARWLEREYGASR